MGPSLVRRLCEFKIAVLLVAMPFVPSSFLLLVIRPGAPSSVLAPSSDALVASFLLLVVIASTLVAMPLLLASCY